jgi:bacterial/archaeal transporter family-2 protein
VLLARKLTGMDRTVAILLTLLAGGLIAFQPPVNAALARHVSDFGAAFVSLAISTLLVGVLFVGIGDIAELKGLSGFKPEHLLGGLGGAAIVLISLVTVRSLGATGVVAVLIAAQLIVSALLDRLAVLGLDKEYLTAPRVIGIALLILGTILVTSR